MKRLITIFNRLFVCPFCVYECKGKINMDKRYLATRHKSRNKLVCGRVVV